MSNRNIIETSKEAYHSLDPKQLTDTYKLIIKALGVLGEATTEEVSAYLRVDHAKLWKRFSELHKMEVIHRPGNKRPMKSGRNGFTWMLTTEHTPKTEKEVAYKKGEKTAADYAGDIIKTTTSYQPDLFNTQQP